MKKRFNIVLIGADYYGSMACSQRIRNMVDGFLLIHPAKILNIVFTKDEVEVVNNKNVSRRTINYNLKSPVSIYRFFKNNSKSLKDRFNPLDCNVLYLLGYPSIENYFILREANKLGYKVVFDIVEKLDTFDLSKSSIKSKFKSYTSRKLLSSIPKLGSVCFGISSTLVDYCKGICKDKIPVVHLPISVNLDYVQSFKNAKGDNGIIRLFYGGSFGFKDGIPLLIEAFTKAAEVKDNIELVLTGKVSKQMSDSLPKLIESSTAKDRIHFLGCLPTEEFYSVMANSDILCMLRVGSDFANAGFPFKLGEYLASGNAIIATRTSDVSNYLTHNEEAYLIQPDSVEEIKNAIVELAGNEGLRRHLADNSKIVAEKYFSMRIVSKILYDSLEKINF